MTPAQEAHAADSRYYSKRGGKRAGAGRPRGVKDSAPRKGVRNPLRGISQWERGEFIGLDGEGYNLADGTHIYALLQASSGEKLFDIEGLSFKSIQEWILTLRHDHPKAIFVIYNGSYDWTKWLSGKGTLDTSVPVVRGLNAGGWLFPFHEWYSAGNRWLRNDENMDPYYGFQVHVIPRKRFHATDYGAWWPVETDGPTNPLTGVKWSKKTVAIWDVFSFFVDRFDRVLEKWLPGDARIGVIREGKERRAEHTRADFEVDALGRMTRYNHAEVTALADLMHKFWEAARRLDVRHYAWDGPGSTAAALFSKYGVGRFRWDSRGSHPYPSDFLKAVFHASFAGRAECIRYGFHHGPVFYADINSAYPDAERKLPCLADGHYDLKRMAGDETLASRTPFILYHVKWDFKEGDLFYPFPWRSKDGGDALYFPPRGEGWYWHWEVEAAARDFEWARHMEILEGWSLTPTCSDEPFSFVSPLYDERNRLKRAHDPAENVIRLGLNSLYGKCAQQAGGTKEDPPRWWEPVWACMITSHCRAKILDAMRDNRRGLVQVATDGFITTERPSFHEGMELGGWKTDSYVAGIFAPTSGVYILKAEDGSEITKARGYNRQAITPLAIIEGWALRKSEIPATGKRFWTLSATITKSLKSNRALERALSKVGNWEDETRTIRLRPDLEGKRDDVNLNARPEKGLVETRPTMPLHRRKLGMSAPGGPRWWYDESDLPALQSLEPEVVID